MATCSAPCTTKQSKVARQKIVLVRIKIIPPKQERVHQPSFVHALAMMDFAREAQVRRIMFYVQEEREYRARCVFTMNAVGTTLSALLALK